MSIQLEDTVAMCQTYENRYWARGHVDKTKFRGRLLSKTPWGLDGDEDALDIISGKVKHGWVITTAGDTSGCGWDSTIHFLTEPLPEGTKQFETYHYDDSDTVMAEIIDGPHEATWWEP